MRWPRAAVALGVTASAIVLAAAPSALAASANVAALQVALRALRLSPGPIDGISGPWTRRAVRRFQARRDLAVDGIAGPHTRRFGHRQCAVCAEAQHGPSVCA